MTGLMNRIPALALLPALFACASQRTVLVESTHPARVLERGQVVCARTPCRFTYSRETCFGFDSSRGIVVLEGVDATGNRAVVTWVTCRAKEGERKVIDFGKDQER